MCSWRERNLVIWTASFAANTFVLWGSERRMHTQTCLVTELYPLIYAANSLLPKVLAWLKVSLTKDPPVREHLI